MDNLFDRRIEAAIHTLYSSQYIEVRTTAPSRQSLRTLWCHPLPGKRLLADRDKAGASVLAFPSRVVSPQIGLPVQQWADYLSTVNYRALAPSTETCENTTVSAAFA